MSSNAAASADATKETFILLTAQEFKLLSTTLRNVMWIENHTLGNKDALDCGYTGFVMARTSLAEINKKVATDGSADLKQSTTAQLEPLLRQYEARAEAVKEALEIKRETDAVEEEIDREKEEMRFRRAREDNHWKTKCADLKKAAVERVGERKRTRDAEHGEVDVNVKKQKL